MGKYDDIIDLPHHVSDRHLPMPIADRAAQFSSFKALTGLEDDLLETARVTDSRMELSEHELAVLNEKFTEIMQNEHAHIKATVFIPDPLKDGGRYETVVGTVKRVDRIGRLLMLTDKTHVRIDDIMDIEEIPESSKEDYRG